jgi:hypothetical protein
MKRAHMPLKTKLAAALHALGLDPSAVDFDHCPALAMRPVDPVTGDTVPSQNDHRFIVPRSREDHKAKTDGTHIPLSGDLSQIAKVKRIERKREEFCRAVLAKGSAPDSPQSAGGRARAASLSPARRAEIASLAACTRWGSRSIPSRPFPKRSKRK